MIVSSIYACILVKSEGQLQIL